jgi:short-subunit dehydrogenase
LPKAVPKTIFITGVSSGIGLGVAEFFLKAGHRVVGTVRSRDSIQGLLDYTNFIFLLLDIRNQSQIEQVPGELLKKNVSTIDVLINNAGVAKAGPFLDQPFSEIEEIINVNLVSLMYLTQKLIPMLLQPGGRIINISSVSGQNGTPFLAAYCASKHAVEGFSESLRRELNLLGIKVIVIGPGSIRTPIWFKGFEVLKTVYGKSIYAKAFEKFLLFAANEEKNGLPVSAVVSDVNKAAFDESPHLRYAPIPKKFKNYYLAKLIPKSAMDRLNVKVLGLK